MDLYKLVNDKRQLMTQAEAEALQTRQAEAAKGTEGNAAKVTRDIRNAKLADCDWIVTKAFESGEPISDEWKQYRAALRDITKHEKFPDIGPDDWPVAP